MEGFREWCMSECLWGSNVTVRVYNINHRVTLVSRQLHISLYSSLIPNLHVHVAKLLV